MKRLGKALVDWLASVREYVVARWRFGRSIVEDKRATRRASRERRKRWAMEIKEASRPPTPFRRRRPY